MGEDLDVNGFIVREIKHLMEFRECVNTEPEYIGMASPGAWGSWYDELYLPWLANKRGLASE